MTSSRFEKNVPVDFYTTGDCLACGCPEEEAPELFAPLEDENWDTYFIRQPANPGEVERACRAVTACCTDAIRYGGTDPAIIRRLGNRAAHSDHVLPGGPVRFPGENGYSWRRVRDCQLAIWERALSFIDDVGFWLRLHLRL